jgi:hypothetical protein
MNAMRFRRSTPFILGPLPLPWFDALATLRGGLVQIVGLEIWRQAGLSGSGAFQFSLKRLSRLGKRRQSIYLALRRIEGLDLIQIEHRNGCRSIVRVTNFHDVRPKKRG